MMYDGTTFDSTLHICTMEANNALLYSRETDVCDYVFYFAMKEKGIGRI